LEDAKFMYLVEDENSIGFQEMPSDYCLIDAHTIYGWLYSFDLNYFSQQGVDINEFPPEFKEYYANYINLANSKDIDSSKDIRKDFRNGR
jgi:hypothetical protein